MSKKMAKYIILIFIVVCFYCAHKGPPLYVDRIDPKIKKVAPINNHQLMLFFSEDLDTLSYNSENFIVHTEHETLRIFVVCPGNTPDQLFLTTEKMNQIKYKITGKVFDKSGRMGTFTTHFVGSPKPDTIAPWVTHYSRGYRLKKFDLEFSEPVDTLSFKYYVMPKKKMQAKWQYLTKVSLIPISEVESLNYDTTYYLYVKDIIDLSGNHILHFATSITPDTTYNPLFIKGKALLNDTSINNGIAIIERNKILGISPVKQGEFSFEVRDSLKYLVHIIIPDFYGADSVSTSQINEIKLKPGAIDFDSLIN